MLNRWKKEKQWAEVGARKKVQASIRPKAKERLTQKPFYLRNSLLTDLMNRRYRGWRNFHERRGAQDIEVT